MKICVVGTGYVGLVAGASFADMGNDVVCCDTDAAKIAALDRGEPPFFEPGLERLCAHNVAEGRLTFTRDLAAGAAGAAVIFLCVGTPAGPDGAPDLGPLRAAAAATASALTRAAVLVVKSTVPAGTTDAIEALVTPVARHPVLVASNPEFLKQGDAVNDFLKPDRIIIGSSDPQAIEILKALYAPFNRAHDRVLVMDRRSAELTKYAANALLASRISFMNELAGLCEALGADIELVRKGVGQDARIGNKFLYAGVGFGGSCFPKDLHAIRRAGQDAGLPMELVRAVISVNDRQKRALGERIIEHFGGSLAGRRVAIWGLSFKPGTDDVREAPALLLVDQLCDAGADVVVTDPEALAVVRARIGDRIRYEDHPLACAQGADALALVTEWREYRRPNFERLKQAMRTPVLFDGRNQWEPDVVRAAGFTYYGIGRGRPGASPPLTDV